MEYKKYNDYELIYMVRENDSNSYDMLFNKYMPIIKRIAYDFYRQYNCYGYELDDFNQEAYIAFHSAIKKYREDKNILFYTFVILCIRRALLTFCRRMTCTKKNISNENFINIDDIDIFGGSNIDGYLEYNSCVVVIKRAMLELDFEDSCIFELRYNGFSYKEISTLLDLPLRHIHFKSKKIRNFLSSQI